MNQYQNIIWDWNGTLLNDVQLCTDIANDLLKNHTQQILSIDEYQNVFGFPITAYYEKIGMDFEKESFEELTEKFIGAYNGNVKNCQLHENVTQLLPHLNKQGITQYILTAAYKKDAIHLLEYFKILDMFKQVEGLDNYRAESKIDRGHLLLKENNIDVAQTVLIGDTIHDYEVATQLNIDCILIANGHQSKERLNSHVGTNAKVIDEIGQLEHLISPKFV